MKKETGPLNPSTIHPMKRTIPLTILLLIILTSTASPVFAGDYLETRFLVHYHHEIANRFYSEREVPGNLEFALNHYRMANNFKGSDAELQWKIARCYWFLADQTPDNQKKQRYFEKGIKAGALAISLDDQSSEAFLWHALLVGSSALDQGVVKTLFNREIIKSGLEKAIALDAKNELAYLGLANWYFYVPALLGGDRQKAFWNLDKAIKLDPTFTMPRMIKAEFQVRENQTEAAIETLQKLLTITNPTHRADGKVNRQKAARLLEQLKTDRSTG